MEIPLAQQPKLVPYAGGGFTMYGYKETSSFSTPAEDVDERFNGYHVIGGVEYKVLRWLGLGGEAAWTTIPDAIGPAAPPRSSAKPSWAGRASGRRSRLDDSG